MRQVNPNLSYLWVNSTKIYRMTCKIWLCRNEIEDRLRWAIWECDGPVRRSQTAYLVFLINQKIFLDQFLL